MIHASPGFQLSSKLWAPQRSGVEETIRLLQDGKSVCLYGCTGSGKTFCASELIRWATHFGIPSCFYINRRLLIGQTYNRFAEAGMDVGVRACDWEDLDNPTAMVQICSADTERSRVYQRKTWQLHDAGLVIVDELHLQRTEVMKKILADYRAMGAYIVGLTATPIGVSKWVDELVVSGSLKEYRECKAIVPAVVRSIEQPDMRKVKRRADGEFAFDGKEWKEISRRYTQQIVGHVIDRWKKYNPDARPTFLYAPGRAESAWLTDQFREAGVPWAHIDSDETYIDGKRYTRSRRSWEDLLGQFRDGTIKGISSRFVLREGVDFPSAYHAILATPIGSTASFIQTVGRILRYSTDTPDQVLVTDHGGNFWRHGSPNAERPWKDWFHMDEGDISRQRHRMLAETGGEDDGYGEREPIRCPQCETERRFGIKCPICGFEHPKGKRYVIQVDGRMKEVEGKLIKKIWTKREPDTQRLWENLFWAWRKSPNTKHSSMAQLEGFFVGLHHYRPPRDMKFMPKNPRDWYQRVSDVDLDLLH